MSTIPREQLLIKPFNVNNNGGGGGPSKLIIHVYDNHSFNGKPLSQQTCTPVSDYLREVGGYQLPDLISTGSRMSTNLKNKEKNHETNHEINHETIHENNYETHHETNHETNHCSAKRNPVLAALPPRRNSVSITSYFGRTGPLEKTPEKLSASTTCDNESVHTTHKQGGQLNGEILPRRTSKEIVFTDPLKTSTACFHNSQNQTNFVAPGGSLGTTIVTIGGGGGGGGPNGLTAGLDVAVALEETGESFFRIVLEIVLPFTMAGFGCVFAGIVLDVVQVGLG